MPAVVNNRQSGLRVANSATSEDQSEKWHNHNKIIEQNKLMGNVITNITCDVV